MPLIEVEDAVMAALAQNGVGFKDLSAAAQKAAGVEAAWNKMLSGPQRAALLRAYKEAYPDAAVPEIDAAAPILSEVEKLRKEWQDEREAAKKEADEKRAKEREEQANTTVASGRRMLRADKKLDDEGVAAVEKIMQDLGIPNYEVAYNHWKAQQPPDPTPLPSAYGNARSLDWFKAEESQPDTKLLLEDPFGFRRKETGKVLQEIREGKFAA